MSQYHQVTMSQLHNFTISPCHNFLILPCYHFTISQFHNITMSQRKVCVMLELKWVPLAINQISNSNSAQTNLSTSTQIPVFFPTLLPTSFKSLYFQRLLHLAKFLFCHISAKDEIFDWIPKFPKVLHFPENIVKDWLRITDEEWGWHAQF